MDVKQPSPSDFFSPTPDLISLVPKMDPLPTPKTTEGARGFQACVSSALLAVSRRSPSLRGGLPRPPTQPPPPDSYPPMSSIPIASPARLHRPEAPSSPTVLYLAYGSNMAASTFLGVRGIRPISRVNVSAPTLDLTFDLPGIPYNEPCFANTVVRKVPEMPPVPPKLPNPLDPSPLPTPPDDGHDGHDGNDKPGKKGVWEKGLIGVVYEVTREDYARIIETEGGGASYLDIMVPCFSLPIKVPTPSNPQLPKPFMAHTLFAPQMPEDDGDKEGDDPDKPEKPWYLRLITPHRRTVAQPSPRYLNLLITGSREHNLPADWQAYLESLTPYTRTSRRQDIGRLVWNILFFPFFMLLFVLLPQLLKWWRRRTGGEEGKGQLPKWAAVLAVIMSNVSWMAHDGWGRTVFGDGEKTEAAGEDAEWGVCARRGACSWRKQVEKGEIDEKVELLG